MPQRSSLRAMMSSSWSALAGPLAAVIATAAKARLRVVILTVMADLLWLLVSDQWRRSDRKRCARGCWGLLKKASGVADLEDAAGVHEPDAVGDFAREAHLVGDAHHRHALGGEAAHDGQHLADHLGVERAGRLVEQHRRRLHRERAGDRHALLLAAGELGRIGRRPWPTSPTRSSSVIAFSRATSRFTPLTLIGESMTLSSAERCGNRLKLWNTKPMRLRRRLSSRAAHRRVHVLPVEGDRAGLDLLQPVDGADQRRLAGAGRAADHDHLAARDLGVDVDRAPGTSPYFLLTFENSIMGAAPGLGLAGSWLGRQGLRRSRASGRTAGAGRRACGRCGAPATIAARVRLQQTTK